jgi:hypothetical protein
MTLILLLLLLLLFHVICALRVPLENYMNKRVGENSMRNCSRTRKEKGKEEKWKEGLGADTDISSHVFPSPTKSSPQVEGQERQAAADTG